MAHLSNYKNYEVNLTLEERYFSDTGQSLGFVLLYAARIGMEWSDRI